MSTHCWPRAPGPVCVLFWRTLSHNMQIAFVLPSPWLQRSFVLSYPELNSCMVRYSPIYLQNRSISVGKDWEGDIIVPKTLRWGEFPSAAVAKLPRECIALVVGGSQLCRASLCRFVVSSNGLLCCFVLPFAQVFRPGQLHCYLSYIWAGYSGCWHSTRQRIFFSDTLDDNTVALELSAGRCHRYQGCS